MSLVNLPTTKGNTTPFRLEGVTDWKSRCHARKNTKDITKHNENKITWQRTIDKDLSSIFSDDSGPLSARKDYTTA